MPPKRKIPARRVSTGKRTSIGIPRTPSGRPQRRGTIEINYKETLRGPGSSGYQADQTDAPKAVTPRKRGRPAKSAIAAQETTDTTPAKSTPAKKATILNKTATPAKAGRGRPKAAVAAVEPAKPVTGKRKRAAEDAAPEPPAKRRGRPPKSETAAPAASAAKSRRKLAVKAEETKKTITPAAVTKRIGRPPGAKNKVPSTKAAALKKSTKGKTSKAVKSSAETEVEPFDEGLTQEADDADEQYWLMKAEPDTRIENGVDVAFPIDKLAAATEPEPWDGVRNGAARNNMRAMRKGDLAFFYHSNCDIPGIVGVMRVAVEHEVDQSAFDPNHPYFDPKSDPAKPKWDCVKVEFVKKFENIISLKTVKETSELSDMQLASKSYGRLSVQKVSPSAWAHILKMAGEPEDLGVAAAKSGYEADTNGETDKEAADDSVGLGEEDEDVEAEKLAAYGDDAEDDGPDLDQQLVIESTQLPVANGITA